MSDFSRLSSLDSVWNCVDSNDTVAAVWIGNDFSFTNPAGKISFLIITANFFVLSFGQRCKRNASWRWLKEFCLFLMFLLPTINLDSYHYFRKFSGSIFSRFLRATNLMSVHGLFRVDGYGSFGYSFVYYSWVINRPPFISTNVICSGNLTELLLIDLGNEMNIPIVHRWTSFFPTLRRSMWKPDIVILRSAKMSTKFETAILLRFSITCGLYNSNLNRQMRFRYRQSDVRRFLPASDYCRARGNQIKSSSTVQTT